MPSRARAFLLLLLAFNTSAYSTSGTSGATEKRSTQDLVLFFFTCGPLLLWGMIVCAVIFKKELTNASPNRKNYSKSLPFLLLLLLLLLSSSSLFPVTRLTFLLYSGGLPKQWPLLGRGRHVRRSVLQLLLLLAPCSLRGDPHTPDPPVV